jgi:hypothetical protein
VQELPRQRTRSWLSVLLSGAYLTACRRCLLVDAPSGVFLLMAGVPSEDHHSSDVNEGTYSHVGVLLYRAVEWDQHDTIPPCKGTA